MKYADFQFGFVLAAIGIALTTGFGYAAVLSGMIGFDLLMGDWLVGMLQAHGHAQLMGWAGLMIVGMSLYFLPRLSGVPLRFPGLQPWICFFLTVGILIRTIGQPFLSGNSSVPVRNILQWGLGLSGILEAAGVGFYLSLLVSTIWGKGTVRPSVRSIRIYFLMAVCGWLSYTVINTVLVLQAAWQGVGLVHMAWNRLGIDLFVALVLLPVAMAFSIRTFPLYLRLPAADWPVQRLGAVYLLAVMLEKAPVLGRLLEISLGGNALLSLGQVLKGGSLLFLVWKLNVLLRVHPPWTVNRIGEPGPERKPTRPGLPDYGEFGRFEWLLYGAYVWLALAACLEIIAGLGFWGGFSSPADPDALRHIYLAGFVSLLIFGMAPRMLPGFLHKRRVAHPALVAVTFWLVGVAAFFRVGPLLLAGFVDYIPDGPLTLSVAFGLSGVLGWAAVWVLAWNLWATWRG